MLIRSIKDLVNSRLAGEQLTYTQLLPYLNATVDDINAKLHSKFATFSEVSLGDLNIEYTEFPDKYIRTVVCVGAAYKWYIDDEEGIATAEALGQEYSNNLFLMERDYGPLVPEDKIRDDRGGFFCDHNHKPSPYDCDKINPDIRYLEVGGYQGTSVTALAIREVDGNRCLIATLTDQTYGSREVNCGIVSPNIVAFQLDIEGDITALMTDGTVYKVGGNLKSLITEQLIQANPVIGLEYADHSFIAHFLNGSQRVLLEVDLTDWQRTYVTTDNNPPAAATSGDIWLSVTNIED